MHLGAWLEPPTAAYTCCISSTFAFTSRLTTTAGSLAFRLVFTSLRSTGVRQPTVSQLQLLLVSCGVVLIFPLLHDELPLGVGENIMDGLLYSLGVHESNPSAEQRAKESHGFLTRGNKVLAHAINHNSLHEEDTAEFL